MNNDLISREALKNSMRKSINERYKHWDKHITVADIATLIFDEIVNAPSVKERQKGEWIRTGSLGNGNAQYECSNCHYGDEHAESREVPYCWHCGADMRKGGAE